MTYLTFEWLPLTLTLGNFLLYLLIVPTYLFSLVSFNANNFTVLRMKQDQPWNLIMAIAIVCGLVWMTGALDNGLNIYIIVLLGWLISTFALRQIHGNELSAKAGTEILMYVPYYARLAMMSISLTLYYLSGCFTVNNELPLKVYDTPPQEVSSELTMANLPNIHIPQV